MPREAGGSRHSGKVASYEKCRLPGPRASVVPSLVAVTCGQRPAHRAGLWCGSLKAVAAGFAFTGIQDADLGEPWGGEGEGERGPLLWDGLVQGRRCWVPLAAVVPDRRGRRRVVAGLARTCQGQRPLSP